MNACDSILIYHILKDRLTESATNSNIEIFDSDDKWLIAITQIIVTILIFGGTHLIAKRTENNNEFKKYSNLKQYVLSWALSYRDKSVWYLNQLYDICLYLKDDDSGFISYPEKSNISLPKLNPIENINDGNFEMTILFGLKLEGNSFDMLNGYMALVKGINDINSIIEKAETKIEEFQSIGNSIIIDFESYKNKFISDFENSHYLNRPKIKELGIDTIDDFREYMNKITINQTDNAIFKIFTDNTIKNILGMGNKNKIHKQKMILQLKLFRFEIAGYAELLHRNIKFMLNSKIKQEGWKLLFNKETNLKQYSAIYNQFDESLDITVMRENDEL